MDQLIYGQFSAATFYGPVTADNSSAATFYGPVKHISQKASMDLI
jgi:hypothetical protein